ncbi:MAG TPA: ATP-binding protein [Methylomusa anaerophila]|uniref:histidine kinase n=1 Tax=Methylomusa anaerophila TaxID=1930071 RepID=A0A348AH52_9FIRM|nr:ATP-binding protein [Methylomusa anaerophila]BBB90400.1 alkaline phosphatase synthesis sensor protein PhoR [Methylomusa anaerophila]HML90386.1 ATP-binding protein [Methylomusa anaerophila]
MFQQLRFKLTLINVAIIFILFVLLIAGAYYRARSDFRDRMEFGARNLIADIKSGAVNNYPPPPPGPFPGVFFVKTDHTGAITFKSAGHLPEPDLLVPLVSQIWQAEAFQGMLTIESMEYFYLKSPLNDQSGMAIVLEDITQTNNMLRRLLTALTITGVVCLSLSFFSSLFMADRAIIPIQNAWQQQKDFLSDASHELRTPLAIMQTNLDVVLDSPEDTIANQRKWLNNIQEETIQMTKLVNSLLFLARADSQQQKLEYHPFALNLAVAATAEAFQPLAAAQGISLHIDTGPQVTVCGDETKFKQVIAILLDNAIRHTPVGGEISLHLSVSGTKTLLTVADSGEGIDPAYLDKIFDRFYQVDKSRSKGGAGLGLAIAKWIIENHQGSIQVASTPGWGTTFTIQMPRRLGLGS